MSLLEGCRLARSVAQPGKRRRTYASLRQRAGAVCRRRPGARCHPPQRPQFPPHPASHRVAPELRGDPRPGCGGCCGPVLAGGCTGGATIQKVPLRASCSVRAATAVRASGIGHRGGTLTLLTSSGDLAHTDPALDYSQTEWQVAALRLRRPHGPPEVGGDVGLQLVPDLAVSLPAPSDGGRSYSFQLRPSIRYSTGALVRPDDFRRTIERSILLRGPGFWFDDVVGRVAAWPHRRSRATSPRGSSPIRPRTRSRSTLQPRSRLPLQAHPPASSTGTWP